MPYTKPLTLQQKMKRAARNTRWRRNHLEQARANVRAWKEKQASLGRYIGEFISNRITEGCL